jgi:hypothetical protein
MMKSGRYGNLKLFEETTNGYYRKVRKSGRPEVGSRESGDRKTESQEDRKRGKKVNR